MFFYTGQSYAIFCFFVFGRINFSVWLCEKCWLAVWKLRLARVVSFAVAVVCAVAVAVVCAVVVVVRTVAEDVCTDAVAGRSILPCR